MRRTLVTLLIGIAAGVLLTLSVLDAAGGWWEYQILDSQRCTQSRALGIAHVAPNQPNPCLLRWPRFGVMAN